MNAEFKDAYEEPTNPTGWATVIIVTLSMAALVFCAAQSGGLS